MGIFHWHEHQPSISLAIPKIGNFLQSPALFPNLVESFWWILEYTYFILLCMILCFTLPNVVENTCKTCPGIQTAALRFWETVLDKVTWEAEAKKIKQYKSDNCVMSFTNRKSKLSQNQGCCKLTILQSWIYSVRCIRKLSLSECHIHTTEMLQAKISHMFDNSIFK